MDPDEKTCLLPPDERINQIYEDDNSSGSSSANEANYFKNKSRPGKRQPFHYAAVHKARTRREAGDSNLATYTRYRYYNRLAHPSIDTLSIPDHVVPADFFLLLSFLKTEGKQSSIITIFAIWNTMMGTSLLCIPWAIQQAGFATGLGIMFLMMAVCFYTAYIIIIIKRVAGIPHSDVLEFPDICMYLLGPWAKWLTAISSVVPLVGCAIVYWILMSNFTYFLGLFVHDNIHEVNGTVTDNSTYPDAFCPTPVPVHHTNVTTLGNLIVDLVVEQKKDTFHKFWDIDGSIPFYMAVCLAPLISLKSPTFFTKFNAVGTFSVIYLIIFIIVKGSIWGIHFDVQNVSSEAYVKLFRPQFPVLIGILSMSFFIHNCVLSIMRNQRYPQNNARDLTIAYVLVGFTYLIIGVGFLITFPYSKNCIEDNLLNNFITSDIFAVCTRAFLLFQVLTLYPLIVYLVRVQILHFMFGSIYPSFLHVLVLNAIILATCILFSIYLPSLGTIMRYCGAFSGLIYIFTMPCIAYMKALKDKNELTVSSIIFHGFLMLLGICSFFAQFFIVKEEDI